MVGDRVFNGERLGVNEGENAGEVKLDSWEMGERGREGNEVNWLVRADPETMEDPELEAP